MRSASYRQYQSLKNIQISIIRTYAYIFMLYSIENKTNTYIHHSRFIYRKKIQKTSMRAYLRSLSVAPRALTSPARARVAAHYTHAALIYLVVRCGEQQPRLKGNAEYIYILKLRGLDRDFRTVSSSLLRSLLVVMLRV